MKKKLEFRAYPVWSDFYCPLPEVTDEMDEAQKFKIQRWIKNKKTHGASKIGERRLHQDDNGKLYVEIFEQIIYVNIGESRITLWTVDEVNAVPHPTIESDKKKKSSSPKKKKASTRGTIEVSDEDMESLKSLFSDDNDEIDELKDLFK